MNPRLVEAKLKTVLANVGATAVQAYDQTHAPEAAQVVVSASVQPTTRNKAGKPVDWAATIRMAAVTHNQDDKSGAVRRALTAAIVSWWYGLTLSTLSVTGFTAVAASDLDVGEAEMSGDEFVAEVATGVIQYMGA